jgi:rRNA pseudouridine-1189 N-methylase Emg1 (Nep1/Mra1 family)
MTSAAIAPSHEAPTYWTLEEVEFIEGQLGREYPQVPPGLIGLVVKLCREDIVAREGNQTLLELARKILDGKMLER